MKTIKQHLEELPEPYRTEALENAKLNLDKYPRIDTIDNALLNAFIFDESPQGLDYWKKLYISLI